MKEINESMLVLNSMVEHRTGTSSSEIALMTPDEEARLIRKANGYGTSITTTKTRGIEGRGSILAALGKVATATDVNRRFSRLSG